MMKKNSSKTEQIGFGEQELLMQFGVLVTELNNYSTKLKEASHIKFVTDIGKRIEFEGVKLKSFLEAIKKNG